MFFPRAPFGARVESGCGQEHIRYAVGKSNGVETASRIQLGDVAPEFLGGWIGVQHR